MAGYAELLDGIRRRNGEEGLSPAAPVTQTQIDSAEAELGFSLPPLLSAVYREIGDGGFGPEYYLGSLAEIVATYKKFRIDNAGTEWAWPEGLLPMMTWGCGMYACVDCRREGGPVLLFEPNPGDPDFAWYIDSPSLTKWFGDYVGGTGWWDYAEDAEMEPWPDARKRAAT